MEVPTLLVGLGGLGSKIVNDIYTMIPKGKRGRVAVLAFDTNINDIKKLDHIPKTNVVQTSSSRTVKQYLANTDESVKEWFPHESGEINRKSLTDGAGQVRAVSRLAYRASIEEGKTNPLLQNLNRIFRINDQNREASPRVMIVTTLAGGTGAGLFLQAALYIRDILETVYNRKNVLIRGTFLLPDILVNTNKIKRGKQVDNIRANAYACIKELNAITQNAQIGGERKMTIELEYKPNQVDIAGRLMHNLTSDHLPYDFCFLYDFENTKGENLQHFENYINQVIKTTYLDLFSPISDGRFSKQDNEIIGLIEEGGKNRFCGSGASALIYPYEDIVKYSSLRWITDSLGKDWLMLDEQYRRDMLDYKKALELGGNMEKPHRGERFFFHLEKMATGESPKPFFRKVFRDGYLLNKDGEPGRSKADTFVQAIETEVERLISTDRKLNALLENLELDETKLKNRKHAKDEVIDMEESLMAYQRAVMDFISKTRNYLINQIVLADEDAPGLMEGRSYHLNTYILGTPEPVHPVTARLILYQIEIMLEKRLGILNEDNDNTLRSIKAYREVFDDPETDDIVEDAEMRMEIALEQGLLSRSFKNRFKEFIKIYRELTSAQKHNLNKYLNNKLLGDVFAGVRKGLHILIRDFERYFENLDEVKDRLVNEQNLLAEKHDKSGDPTTIYVMASKENKEKIWDDISLTMLGSELPPEISEQIYAGQYKRFCLKQRGKYVTEERPEKVEEMFRKDVIDWCNGKLYQEDRLNYNIVRALQKQAELLGTDADEIGNYIISEVAKLNNLANPFVPRPMNQNYTAFNTYGIHPDCIDYLNDDVKNEAFVDDLTINDAFSPYEILRNNTIYSLSIDDFTKFHCGDSKKAIEPGTYYISYQKRIDKLNKSGRTITPHLDKRWHSPYYLPPLHDINVKRTNENISRALSLGLMMGVLEASEADGKYSWLFHGPDYNKWVSYGDNNCGEYVYNLHKALTRNMGLVDSIISRSDEIRRKDKTKHGQEYKNFKFYEQAAKIYYAPAGKQINVLDILLMYNDYHSISKEDKKAGIALVKSFADEVKAIFLEIFGDHQPNKANAEGLKFMKRLVRGSMVLKSAEETSRMKKMMNNLLDNF